MASPRPGLLLAALLAGCLPGPGPQPGEYTVTVEPVDEVCAVGPVRPEWAAQVLVREGLAPAGFGGAPRGSLCVTSSAFHGVAFREAVYGLYVVPIGAEGEGAPPELFLVAALESLRSFAWVERTRNASPYHHGTVQHTVGPGGIDVHLATPEGEVLAARSAALPGAPEPAVFEGRIFQRGRTFFYARLEGTLDRRRAAPGDSFVVGPDAAGPFAEALRASAFVPGEWWVRPAGRHAKGDTASVE